MSLYQKASLVQIPSGYKAASAKLYSVVPSSGDGDFTVSSDADATRINDNGLIETIVANQARLNYDPSNPQDPHLLLEPTRTNQILHSEDFTNAVWQKLGGGSGVAPVVTANYSTAPNGSNTADRVVFDMGSATSGDNYSIIRNFGTSGSTGTNSVYIKSNTTDSYTMGIDNVGTVELITVTPQWQRFSYSNTSSDRLQLSLRGAGASTSRYADVSIWGGSLESGTHLTSYIPTTSEAVTRTSDSCEIASGLEDIIGQTEGTLFLDFEYLYQTTSDPSTDAFRDIFVMGTTSDLSEGISIDNYRGTFRVFVIQAAGNITLGGGSAQANTRYKLAVKYKTGDCKAYLNGTLLGSSTGTVNFASVLNGIFFSYNSGSRPFKNQKKVYQLMVFNTALSNSELIQLTS